MSEEKIYISADQLALDSFQMAANIVDSGFRPDYIIGIWRGGTPVGIAVQELLDYVGIKTDHIAIRTSYYRTIGKTKRRVQVHGLGYIVDRINQNDGLLIVDDVFDTGNSIDAVFRHLSERARRNMPEDIRVATPWYKPSKNQTDRTPDYFIHETDRWLVFPHELQGLSIDEIALGKGQQVASILQSLRTKD